MLNNNSQAKLGCQLHLMLLMFSLLFFSFLASSLFSSVLYFLLVATVAYAQFACSSSCSMQCRCLDCDKYRLIDVAVVLISRVFVCVFLCMRVHWCPCVCVCLDLQGQSSLVEFKEIANWHRLRLLLLLLQSLSLLCLGQRQLQLAPTLCCINRIELTLQLPQLLLAMLA